MIGVLMLDTQFPRFPGDIGNPQTFSKPPLYKVVDRATPGTIVSDQPLEPALLKNFVNAAQHLESEGVRVIATSCGFLASAQEVIQTAIKVPFISSSLVLLPLLQRLFGPNSPVGVLTFDQNKLGPIHFAGDPGPSVSIHALEKSGAWYQCIAENKTDISLEVAKSDAIQVAQRCIDTHPNTQYLLIECTNLSPFKQEMRLQFKLPVFDIVDAIEWIYLSTG